MKSVSLSPMSQTVYNGSLAVNIFGQSSEELWLPSNNNVTCCNNIHYFVIAFDYCSYIQ